MIRKFVGTVIVASLILFAMAAPLLASNPPSKGPAVIGCALRVTRTGGGFTETCNK